MSSFLLIDTAPCGHVTEASFSPAPHATLQPDAPVATVLSHDVQTGRSGGCSGANAWITLGPRSSDWAGRSLLALGALFALIAFLSYLPFHPSHLADRHDQEVLDRP